MAQTTLAEPLLINRIKAKLRSGRRSRLTAQVRESNLAMQCFFRACGFKATGIERDAFKRMPKSMQLAAGIIDEGSYWIESVKKIRERIADWARVVGEERLWVSPSCGFGRHPARDIPVLRAKVENMVEAARTL